MQVLQIFLLHVHQSSLVVSAHIMPKKRQLQPGGLHTCLVYQQACSGQSLRVKMSVCLVLQALYLERLPERLSLFVSVFTGAARQAGQAARSRFDCALAQINTFLNYQTIREGHWPCYGPDLERETCQLSLFKTQLTKADKNVPCRGRFTEAGMSNSIKPFLRRVGYDRLSARGRAQAPLPPPARIISDGGSAPPVAAQGAFQSHLSRSGRRFDLS